MLRPVAYGGLPVTLSVVAGVILITVTGAGAYYLSKSSAPLPSPINRLTGQNQTTSSATSNSPSAAANPPAASAKTNSRSSTPSSTANSQPAPATSSGSSTGSGGSTPPSSPQPVGVSGNWTLKFDNEFSGSSLNSPWKSGWWDASTNNSTTSQSHGSDNCYSPGQVGVGGGYLSLTAISQSCTTTDGSNLTYSYKSGAINTAGTVTAADGTHYTHSGGYYFTYGYTEARIYIPPNTSNPSSGIDWPAFWMVSDYNKGVTTPELDVMELLNSKLCGHLHASSGSYGVCSSTTTTAGWHTFGANWQTSGVTFYYDGQSIGQLTSGVPTTPMYLFLDLAVSASIGNPPVVTPATMQVDYVRVWQ